jgi:hypothetical protein
MSAFKNQLLRDVENTFLNQDEFADMHKLAGKEMMCVIDEDTFGKRTSAMETLSRLAMANSIEAPIYSKTLSIYVSVRAFDNALGGQYANGAELLIDDKRNVEIVSFEREGDMYHIIAKEVCIR